jgi:mono/diheme cytochrome c family protein
MRLRHALIVLVGVTLLGIAGFSLFAWRPEIPAAEPASNTRFDRELIEKGAKLAMIGNCNVCHTKANGIPYAGGQPLQTPFGTVFTTNITPDPDSGIGRWSEAAFERAMRQGVRRDGAHLYPAFPYDHFTKVADADVSAIYAFLMTREPVRSEIPDNNLVFPFSVRALIAGWKLLFFTPGQFRADPALTEELNRGVYLVEGLAHCGGCHTPRNALGAERKDAFLGGGEAEGWHAPALNGASTAPVPWTTDQLFTYLRRGFVAPHGVAAGPMQPVANNLETVLESDVNAIAAYVGRIVGPPTAGRKEKIGPERKQGSGSLALGGESTIPAKADGAILYAGACASCHDTTGQRFSARGIHLASSKVITMPDARNLAHVILEGISPPHASPAAMMPGFADALTDTQVAALMTYLRSTFSDGKAWTHVEETVREVRGAALGP